MFDLLAARDWLHSPLMHLYLVKGLKSILALNSRYLTLQNREKVGKTG
jgi:hypothetical protein